MPINSEMDSARRLWLKQSAIGAGLLGLSSSGWLNQVAMAAGKKPAKRCIMLWMSGGPSQTETLDPKQGQPNGGPTRSIETNVPGIKIADNLPGVAAQMQDIALIRSMQTKEGDHGRASQLMKTGYRPMSGVVKHPVLGSIVAQRLHETSSELPGFVAIAPSMFTNAGSGYLGPKYSPLIVSGSSDDPNARANLTIENLAPKGVDAGMLSRRKELLSVVRGAMNKRSDAAEAHAAIYDQAMRMVETRGGGAFDLEAESDALRDAYGRNRFGQGCLLARRLIERGVSFVEVTLSSVGGATWDSHVDNFKTVSALCETLDPAWSTLVRDLRDRDMLDSTLVVWMGEFGRTPKINTSTGRDHFANAWSVALAGGGVPGGSVIGKTSDDGESVVDQPVSASDLYATVLKLLDIDPYSENYDGDRPIPIVDEGTAIEELLA